MNQTNTDGATPHYEVAPARDARDEWIVEAINHEGDGEIYIARFSGPRARERATEYAEWKNLQQSLEDLRNGRVTDHEDLKRELGL